MKRTEYWLLPAIFLLMAALLWISGANQNLFTLLNSGLSWIPGILWANITLQGSGLVALALLAPFAYRRPELLWTALLAGLLTVVLVQGLKHGLHLPRPLAVLPASSVVVTGRPLHANSFPSGHAATAAALAAVLWWYLPSAAIRGSILAWAWLVALSRLAVGAHWPSDVLVGFACGWLCAAAAMGWQRYWSWGSHGRGAEIVSLVFSLLPLLLFIPFDSGYPQADPLRYLIGAAGGLLAVITNLRYWRPGGARD